MSCARLLFSSDRVARSAATSACEGSSHQPIVKGIAAESAATPTLHAARRRLAACLSARRLSPARRLSSSSAPSSSISEIGRAHVELQSQSNLVCRLLLEKQNN